MSQAQARWDQLADELEAADPAVSRSTMMGLPCLRFDGAFFASLDKRGDRLVVKLAAADVSARVADGRGRSFAPSGRVFREWVSIEGEDERGWRQALEDALAFARTK